VAWDTAIGAATPAHVGDNAVWCRDGLGLWDDAAGAPNAAVFPAVMAERPGALRFPGGTRAMRYHFDEAVGPPAVRKAQCDTFLGSTDATRYGLDEFMKVAGALGADVSLVAPWVDGTPEEAAALVAYANAPSSAAGGSVTIGVDENGKDWKTAHDWAALRAANGHPAPYGARWLEVGNEQYLAVPTPPPTSCGRNAPFRQNERWVRGVRVPTTPGNHAEGVAKTAALVHAVDPRVRVGASTHSDFDGKTDAAQDPWNAALLSGARGAFDFFVLHPYVLPAFISGSPDAPQDRVALVDGLTKTVRDLHAAAPEKGIAVTEYGAFLGGDTLDAALLAADVVRVAVAEGLEMALRHLLVADDPLEPFASGGSVLGPLHTETPAYRAMQLLASSLEAVAVHATTDDAGFGVLATRDAAQRRLAIIVVDRHAMRVTDSPTFSVDLPPGRWNGTMRALHGSGPDAHAADVRLDASPIAATGPLVVQAPAGALTVIALEPAPAP
jgi:hypothetical protein